MDKIGFGRNDAAEYVNLKEFLGDYDNKNQIKEVSNIEELTKKGYETITRVEKRGPIFAKFYYINADGWVYVFSTSSEKLYNDLDQIVQTSHYIK